MMTLVTSSSDAGAIKRRLTGTKINGDSWRYVEKLDISGHIHAPDDRSRFRMCAYYIYPHPNLELDRFELFFLTHFVEIEKSHIFGSNVVAKPLRAEYYPLYKQLYIN